MLTGASSSLVLNCAHTSFDAALLSRRRSRGFRNFRVSLRRFYIIFNTRQRCFTGTPISVDLSAHDQTPMVFILVSCVYTPYCLALYAYYLYWITWKRRGAMRQDLGGTCLHFTDSTRQMSGELFQVVRRVEAAKRGSGWKQNVRCQKRERNVS